jgi:enamine deaminase RidA (YjgF/YER057c/UK114 family)
MMTAVDGQQSGGGMRKHVSSGTEWESRVGYARALRVGPLVYVLGTTATDDAGRLVGEGDAYAQAAYALAKIRRALEEAGAGMEHVVRTRIFVTRADDWPAVGRAHAEALGDVRPANTLVEVSALIGAGYLVEIEADAVIDQEL